MGVSGLLGHRMCSLLNVVVIKLVQYVAMFCLGVCMLPVVCCAVCACIGIEFFVVVVCACLLLLSCRLPLSLLMFLFAL